MGTSDICELVVEEIKKSKIKIVVLAERSGIAESTIRGWLKGRATPSIENAQFVLSVLGKELCVKEKIGEVRNDG